MSEQQAMDWADELALEVIALVHRYRIETARQLIAVRFKQVRVTGEIRGATEIVANIQKREADARPK